MLDSITRLSVSNHGIADPTNCYVIESAKRVVLVDTGMATTTTRSNLESLLGVHGLDLGQVTDLLLTHWHTDHAGLVETIRSASGATVYVHRDDAPLVEENAVELSRLGRKQIELLDSWNVPDAKIRTMEQVIGQTSTFQETVSTVECVADRDRISSGPLEFEVVHTPGHTKGHTCYALRTDRGEELLVGDTVLPDYTPNIGGTDPRVERPFETYLESLSRIRTRGIETLHPGHGRSPIDSTPRIEAILSHHVDRLADIVDILDPQSPLDVWTVSTRLFGDLEGPHIFIGAGEAHAHLEFLENAGVIERAKSGYLEADGERLPEVLDSLP